MFASEAAVADIQIKCDTKSLVKVVPRRVKISIASDFRKNNSILAAAILAGDQADQQKKWDFCAHATCQPRRNEWAIRSFDEAPFPATSANKDFEISVRLLNADGRDFIFQTATNTQSPNPYRLVFFACSPIENRNDVTSVAPVAARFPAQFP